MNKHWKQHTTVSRGAWKTRGANEPTAADIAESALLDDASRIFGDAGGHVIVPPLGLGGRYLLVVAGGAYLSSGVDGAEALGLLHAMRLSDGGRLNTQELLRPRAASPQKLPGFTDASSSVLDALWMLAGTAANAVLRKAAGATSAYTAETLKALLFKVWYSPFVSGGEVQLEQIGARQAEFAGPGKFMVGREKLDIAATSIYAALTQAGVIAQITPGPGTCEFVMGGAFADAEPLIQPFWTAVSAVATKEPEGSALRALWEAFGGGQ